jgi:ABC-type glycerol-3-phosphate transport system substrate-binding protein
VGKCNVYCIDEANVALFAKSNWVTPLLDYYPKDYDFADFDLGRQKVATFEDKVHSAPLTGGGDLLVYRKDLLEKGGVKVPTSPPAPFLSGQVALLVESTPLSGEAIDPKVSKVVGKVGYAPPPSPLTGGGYAHGLAIGAKANKDDAAPMSLRNSPPRASPDGRAKGLRVLR